MGGWGLCRCHRHWIAAVALFGLSSLHCDGNFLLGFCDIWERVWLRFTVVAFNGSLGDIHVSLLEWWEGAYHLLKHGLWRSQDLGHSDSSRWMWKLTEVN